MNVDLVTYYRERANEYEKIYSKPERQSDLLQAGQILQKIFKDKNVFEIACGTGYWTEKLAVTAKNILATDINNSAIDIAKTKNYHGATVWFQTADIFSLTVTAKHQSLFGGFIWSHIKRDELKKFIDITDSLVESGGTIVFMDNNYIEGSSHPLTGKDDSGNTYQTRKLENGTVHKILKNFPTERFIKTQLAPKAASMNFINLQHYWMVEYNKL